jgi:AraC family transcriptional regulator
MVDEGRPLSCSSLPPVSKPDPAHTKVSGDDTHAQLAPREAAAILSLKAGGFALRRSLPGKHDKTIQEQLMLRNMDELESEGSEQAFRPVILQPESDLPVQHLMPPGTMVPAGFARGGLPPRVLRRIREYIEGNIDRRISVELLAGLANLSVCYFVRAFKHSMGTTPHDYLIRQRVERTKHLLSGGDMPLSEIALAAGFADQSHFSRRFRQHVGMSPRDYRWSSP